MSGVEKGHGERDREEGDTRPPYAVYSCPPVGVCYSFPLLVVCPSGRRCITEMMFGVKPTGFKSSTTATNETRRDLSRRVLHVWLVLGGGVGGVYMAGILPGLWGVCHFGALPMIADLGVGRIVLCVLRF